MKKFSILPLSVDLARSQDEEVIRRLLAMAFGFDSERTREYIRHATVDAFRVVRTPDGRVEACAALIDTAHVFGGRDVRAANIAHVAVAPEARGKGLARPLVDALCEDARRVGASMVSLFASARPVYRKCGFELAGSEIVYEAETAALPPRSAVDFEAVSLDDQRITKAYARKSGVEAGLLRRSEIHWREIGRNPRDCLAAYGAGGEELDAYVILDAGDPDRLVVRDWHAADGRIADALLCFLGRFRSVYPKVTWHGGPQDDLVAAMPDKGWRLAHQEEWLARILDPVAALRERGYAPGSARLGLRIGEPGGDACGIRLEVSSGRAEASPGDTADLPTVTVGTSDFASLFTGFRSASKLARQGALSGSTEAVQLCDRVFAGPQPWVAEHF